MIRQLQPGDEVLLEAFLLLQIDLHSLDNLLHTC